MKLKYMLFFILCMTSTLSYAYIPDIKNTNDTAHNEQFSKYIKKRVGYLKNNDYGGSYSDNKKYRKGDFSTIVLRILGDAPDPPEILKNKVAVINRYQTGAFDDRKVAIFQLKNEDPTILFLYAETVYIFYKTSQKLEIVNSINKWLNENFTVIGHKKEIFYFNH